MIRAGERLGGHWPNLPSNWRVVRADALFVYRKDIVTVSELDGVEVVHYSIPALGAGGEPVVEDGATIASSKFRVRGDEVLVSKLNPRKGHVFLTEAHDRLAVCSTEFVPLVPRAEVDRRFAYYLYHSTPVRERISATVQSATRSHQRANPDQIYKVWVPAPPISEQTSIADFLDEKTAAIDVLIAKKERLIELIEEKRQATITRAVTKGLDPDVPMKDSGVEWLGEVPAHWTVKRLMHLTPVTRQIMYGIVLPGPHVEGGIPIVKSGDCWPDRLRLDRLNRTTPEIEAPYARARLEPGDIVYAIRGSVGASAKVPAELRGANLTQDAARIAPRPDVDSDWLLFATQSRNMWWQVEAGILGATVKGINIRDLKRIYLPVPPTTEQQEIATALMSRISAIDEIVENAKESVTKLHEYRQALISTAVTGQLDVRSRTARALDPTALEPLEEVLT